MFQNMTTYTTSQFRDHLADVFAQVVGGEEVVLVLGRGRRAKKIKLTQLDTHTQKKSESKTAFQSKHSNIQAVLQSPEFQKFKPPKELMEAQNVEDFVMSDYLQSKF